MAWQVFTGFTEIQRATPAGDVRQVSGDAKAPGHTEIHREKSRKHCWLSQWLWTSEACLPPNGPHVWVCVRETLYVYDCVSHRVIESECKHESSCTNVSQLAIITFLSRQILTFQEGNHRMLKVWMQGTRRIQIKVEIDPETVTER